MQCDQFDLVGFRDGELSLHERTEVQAHLDHCPTCRKELASIESTMALLREYCNAGAQSCPATDALVEFHDGLSRPQESGSIRRHIEGCAECTRLLQLLDSLGDESSFDDSGATGEQLPQAVRDTLAELRQESLGSRLKRTFETVVSGGTEQLKKTPGVVSEMVRDLVTSREPDAMPSLAVSRNTADVKSEDEAEADHEKTNGRGGRKNKRKGKRTTR